jgi:ectoine hydroxylase-related dioxygenase (phytanoyl-CoA dioxygenase family)
MALALDEVTIDDDVRAAYHRDGYWVSPVLFEAAELAELREAVTQVCSGVRDYDRHYWLGEKRFDDSSLNVRQVCNGWWVNRRMRQLLTEPVISGIGAALMQTDEVRLWHDQMIFKPGAGAEATTERAGNIGWHQDYAHWQCADTDNFVTAWIALQDTDLQNGGMRTIAGSHTWGLLDDAYTFGEKDLDMLEQKFRGGGREWRDEPCVLKAGQVSFHHALTLHGSGPNLTDQPRLSIIMHMMPRGCALRRVGRFHPNADMVGPFAADGTPFDGPHFPRLWPTPAAPLADPG